MDPVFVIVVGPIASGKSTTALAIADRLRERGRTVAVLDPDDVVELIGGFPAINNNGWLLALQVHAVLVGAWLKRQVDVVAPGPFYDEEENSTLLAHVPSHVQPYRVLLRTPYEVALQRVAHDTGRGRSADSDFLLSAYERFDALLPSFPHPQSEWDTTIVAPEAIAEAVVAAALRS